MPNLTKMPFVTSIFLLITMLLQPVFGASAAEVVWETVIHSDSIDALCAKDNYVYSASFDGHIKRSTADSVEEIGAHHDWVRALLCINSSVVSASNDGRIIIWNGPSRSKQIHAHDWWITDIAFHKDTIISVSLDETVKIWHYPDLKPLYQHKLYGSRKHHTVAICRNKAFIGSTWAISVLDLNTRKWISHLTFGNPLTFGNLNVYLSSTASDNAVYFGDDTGKLFCIDAFTSKLLSTSHVSRTAIKALAYHQGRLFVGDDEGIIRAVDAESMENTEILDSFPESVRAIIVRGDTLIAGYDGGILRAIKIP